MVTEQKDYYNHVAKSSGHDERELDLYTIRSLGLEDKAVKSIAEFFLPGGWSNEGYNRFKTTPVINGVKYVMDINLAGVSINKTLTPEIIISEQNIKSKNVITFVDPFKEKWVQLMLSLNHLSDSYLSNLNEFRVHFAYRGVEFYMNYGDSQDDYVFKDNKEFSSFIDENKDKIVEIRKKPILTKENKTK